jgi:metal-dependent HD superfamily phosphatase/phosphodiesterase
MFSTQIFQENTFLETKLNFSLIEKYFSLTNFFNNKQTQKNLKNNFLKK